MQTLTIDSPQPAAYTLEDQRRMSVAKNYFAWQGRLVSREIGRRVIELGCGVGNFTGTLLDREAVMALDKEPSCIERLKLRYPNRHNLDTFTCDADVLDERRCELAGFGADSCVCLNVLEHIGDDAKALRAMASILTPGGVIVLLVPAFPALYGPIDKNLGHHRRYTRNSITQPAASAGLRVKKAHYFNCVGFLGWWINSHILKREAQSEKQIETFDRLVPVLSRMEDIAHPPFGQSLFVVLQKPC
ncbi:MAG: class I SAM-dependent methyltransferase [Candidatus Acidiferrales bacterium]|jgi:SAM-dependent methyltransferase